MKFKDTPIAGVKIVEYQAVHDERGYFARTWDSELVERHRLNQTIAQISTSFNQQRGTLRGLHWQRSPLLESKLVRCTRGAIFDVVVDLRTSSPTYGAWYGHELSADGGTMLYIPEGCAHGFQTLADNSEVLYLISVPYQASLARGVKYNDPDLAITWPLPVTCISDRDKNFPAFNKLAPQDLA